MDTGLDSRLESIRTLPLDKLKVTYQGLIPANLAPPASFWASYEDVKLAIGLRACLVVWEASGNKIVPKGARFAAANISAEDFGYIY